MQARATNLDPKLIKVLSMPDYVPSTGPAKLVESGRRLDFVSNHSLVGSGKYHHGRLQQQRLSARKPRVGKSLPTVRVKKTAAATSAAIKVSPLNPPISLAHRLLQLPYLPKYLKYTRYRRSGMYDASTYSITLRILHA